MTSQSRDGQQGMTFKVFVEVAALMEAVASTELMLSLCGSAAKGLELGGSVAIDMFDYRELRPLRNEGLGNTKQANMTFRGDN